MSTRLGKDRIIVALDVPNTTQALTHVLTLRECVGAFKVGLQLFTAEGPAVVQEIKDHGGRVFLDLKFHDIPNTVAGAVEAACGLGVWMLNVHCLGGEAMMRAAASTAAKHFTEHGRRPLIIGVTILTSHDLPSLRKIGINVSTVEEAVVALAKLAAECGLDGVVCSPQEVSSVRQAVCDDGFVIVTPGIRDANAPPDDQCRTTTAAAAVLSGSHFIVAGRPILKGQPDPVSAAQSMAEQIDKALARK